MDRIIDTPVQQVPEPMVHTVLRWDPHLPNLKCVRRILSEESCGPNELERRRCLLADKIGMSQNQVHGRLQPRRIAKFRVNLVVFLCVDRTGIFKQHKFSDYIKLTFPAIREVLQYRSRRVALAFAYDRGRVLLTPSPKTKRRDTRGAIWQHDRRHVRLPRVKLVIPEGKCNSSRNVWQKLVNPSETPGVS